MIIATSFIGLEDSLLLDVYEECYNYIANDKCNQKLLKKVYDNYFYEIGREEFTIVKKRDIEHLNCIMNMVDRVETELAKRFYVEKRVDNT